jgi:hypothetical protein
VAFRWLYRNIGGYFRRRRGLWLFQEFNGCSTVVDLGGTAESWAGPHFEHTMLVNRLPPNRDALPEGFTYLQADACRTGLSGPFDLAFSNSSIEHLGTWDRQREFAREMLRLGRHVYCQTPNRWFPIEPHYLALFVHWLPRDWFGHFAHRWFTLQGWTYRPSRSLSHAIRQRESVRLLTRGELAQLFPGCHLRTERLFLLPKSFVIWR